MNKSIAKNSIFYFIYNVLNMVFPFISSMYVARILTPNSIGEVALAQNIVSYFSILAFLGIPTYGMREISKNRNNQKELNRLYSELFTINLISTIVFSILYYGLIFAYPRFRESFALYSLVGVTVVLNMLNISWLYEGLEEFGYISKRNAIFKLLMLCLLIVLVRDEHDIISYAAINVVGVAGNNLINVFHSKRYVSVSFSKLNLKRHMRTIFMLVSVNLAIEIYTLADTTMLGLLSTNEHVAFYTYASRVNRIFLQVTNTITMVLVPRISFVYKENNYVEFNRLLTKGLKVILIFSIPMIIGIQFTASFVFTKIYGLEYISSSVVERILSFILIVSPIGYLLGSRVMLVSENEKKMFLCVSFGAIINIIGNYILIQSLNEYGAAIVSVISELVVMIMYLFQGRKVFKLEKYSDTLIKVIASSSAEFLFLLFCNNLMGNSWIRLFVEVIGGASVYLIVLVIEKEELITPYLASLRKKLIFHSQEI